MLQGGSVYKLAIQQELDTRPVLVKYILFSSFALDR